MRLLLFIGLLLVSQGLYAQRARAEAEAETVTKTGTTEKTSNEPDTDAKDYKKGQREILTLVVNKPSMALPGNLCYEEYVSSLGLKYEIAARGKAVYSHSFLRFFHNTGVRIRTTFRNGPFWSLKLRKKRRECRITLHDYMG